MEYLSLLLDTSFIFFLKIFTYFFIERQRERERERGRDTQAEGEAGSRLRMQLGLLRTPSIVVVLSLFRLGLHRAPSIVVLLSLMWRTLLCTLELFVSHHTCVDWPSDFLVGACFHI